MRADVSNPADAEKMVAETVKHFGKLNVLYNNAGIEGEANLTARFSVEGFERVIAINLRGVFLGMKYAIPEMIKAGGGSIINTSSTAGLDRNQGRMRLYGGQAWRDRADQDRGDRVRTAQHQGQRDLPRPDRHAAAGAHRRRTRRSKNVTVETMGAASPMGRPGAPEEIARVALFLASDEASYANGAAFAIDGGMLAT